MRRRLEVWGGVECTVNRVGDTWRDQLALSGHSARLTDLDLIAELGIRTIRFPLLWELTVEPSSGMPQWEWADRWLTRLRELGIRPILGLMHHGSGPRFTDLLDPDFAPRLAGFAAEVATRFPWVTDYTPINEPLTTARFSALYGHWYPHRRDNSSFCRAFLSQCRGIVLAMQAIRRVTPDARLIQTEDLGTTHSTEHMAYQADFDNERRWLTWDLLCGKVSREHPLTAFFLQSACTPSELEWFSHHPCAPAVIGVNHYVTSDRFLDERLDRYPGESAGTNSLDTYVDLPAVRVLPGAYRGWRMLEAAWRRYKIPLALTEVHLGCTREEQLRWFQDAWNAADAMRHRGAEVVAVTSWALFGSYDWDHLLTRDTGYYEPGAFDCSGGVPRPSALAHLLRRRCDNPDAVAVHPTMRSQGWWQRPSKLTYALAGLPLKECEAAAVDAAPVIVLIGGDSPLGRAVATACERRNLAFRDATHEESSDSRFNAWVIIDARVEGESLAAITGTDWDRLANVSLDQLIDDVRGIQPEPARRPALSFDLNYASRGARVHRVQERG